MAGLSPEEREKKRQERQSRGQCAAGCGDPATAAYAGKYWCFECLKEVQTGYFDHSPANLHAGRDKDH